MKQLRKKGRKKLSMAIWTTRSTARKEAYLY
jgi:hypothetical protein